MSMRSGLRMTAVLLSFSARAGLAQVEQPFVGKLERDVPPVATAEGGCRTWRRLAKLAVRRQSPSCETPTRRTPCCLPSANAPENMPQPRVLILRAPGTNCDHETAHAFRLAGAAPRDVHVNQLVESPGLLAEFQVLCVPGGFSYGDDVAAGRILANRIQGQLRDSLLEFKAQGKLILGICNGFQALLKAGLFWRNDSAHDAPATLTWNDSGRFEDRWVRLSCDASRCVFLTGLQSLYLPVAHAEGKFVAHDRDTFNQVRAAGQLVLRYATLRGDASAASPEGLPFPDNPNGSWGAVAGICDADGRVLGLMPHPERHVDPTQHPHWTRQAELPPEGEGLAIFRNAVAYFETH